MAAAALIALCARLPAGIFQVLQADRLVIEQAVWL